MIYFYNHLIYDILHKGLFISLGYVSIYTPKQAEADTSNTRLQQ